MSTFPSMTELRKMSLSELRKDLKSQHGQAAKMRLTIKLGKEKNHAAYRALKKHIARSTMVLTEFEKKGLPESETPTTLKRPKASAKKTKDTPTSSKKAA